MPPVSIFSSSSLGILRKQCIVSSSSCSIDEFFFVALLLIGNEPSRCFDGICIVIVCDVPSAEVDDDIRLASIVFPTLENAPKQLYINWAAAILPGKTSTFSPSVTIEFRFLFNFFSSLCQVFAILFSCQSNRFYYGIFGSLKICSNLFSVEAFWSGLSDDPQCAASNSRSSLSWRDTARRWTNPKDEGVSLANDFYNCCSESPSMDSEDICRVERLRCEKKNQLWIKYLQQKLVFGRKNQTNFSKIAFSVLKWFLWNFYPLSQKMLHCFQ